MADNTANQPSAITTPPTIAEIIENLEPMGDLSRFAIADLSPDEEHAFFAILESA